MKLQAIAIMTFLTFMNVMAQETIKSTDMNTLELTQEWDKTFPQSDKVEHTKITFHNRYGITLAADLYKPKNVQGQLAAIAVSGPYGATKEQVSGRYAQTLAERGFLTIAFDPSYYGESGGTPRYLTSPEISTEDFSAAVDYLTSSEDVDMERIGILGICGWGGFALNAAANDPRIKATVTSTMYDMSRVNANGYFDANDNADARYEQRQAPKHETTLTIRQVQAATASLEFLRQFAPLPVRITKIGRATAIEADFQGVPFSTFISADNYYQGFLHTKNEALLKDLATLLYPKVKSRHLTTPLLLNAFYWFSSLKHYFARLFPHFLQPMSSSSEDLLGYAPPIGEVLRTAMNAQIRALTGGDITKEEAVLSMDTWRALTELDAKAKEVEDIKRQTK